jgi:hypothetical protein
MMEKVVGAGVVALCFLLGGFLTVASYNALMNGKDDSYLYGLAAFGVVLILGGCAMLVRLARRQPPKRTQRADPDESW